LRNAQGQQVSLADELDQSLTCLDLGR
jgi:hypothetical protein